MREILPALLSGFLFGLGLCLSGMTDPTVVLGFLDVAGEWNPALMFVMAGGATITFLGYQLSVLKTRPLWASRFSLPAATRIDAPLLAGAAVFGLGWGLAGYCPGPAVASLASGRAAIFLFVIAMAAGMILVRWIRISGSVGVKTRPLEGNR